jgi:DNA-binding NarL/FixJ family response regulator
MTNILIVEDEVKIAEDLIDTCRSFGYELLEPSFGLGDAMNKLQTMKVDLLLLDMNLDSNLNGIEFADYVNKEFNIPFIYLSSFSDPEIFSHAKDTRPLACITKPFKKTDIFSLAIALQNHGYLHSKGFPSMKEINENLLSKITKREYELLNQIHQGKSNQQLAEIFLISLNTVKSHLKNVYSKLEVDSRVSALSKIRKMNMS